MANERSFSSLGARVIELDLAWKDRLEDAIHLKSAGRYPTAIAMGIYALEILLKVRICRLLQLDRLPKPFEIHELEGLMMVSGLKRTLLKKQARTTKKNWTAIVKISAALNDLRYSPNGSKSQAETDDFFGFLNEPSTGVIPWIASQP
jgi:hypothetical protein